MAGAESPGKGKRSWRSWLPTSLLIGAGTHLGLMLFALLDSSGLSYFGVTNDQITATIEGQYLGLLAAELARIGLGHLLVGSLLGLLVGRLLTLAGGRWRGTGRLGRAARLAGGVLLLHGVLLCASMSRYPQLYVESFHAKGGLAAWLQRLVTDSLPDVTWTMALLVVAFAWLALELRRIVQREWPAPGVAAAPVVLGLGILLLGSAPSGEPPARAPLVDPGPKGARPAVPERPNLLILAADSLRPDRLLDGEGGTRPVAPHLKRLAREGVSFRRAYTVMPRTFPAWISMLTGQYSHHHGVRTMFPTVQERSNLPPAVPQLLARHGYATAVVSDFAGDIFSRVPLGFQQVHAPYFHFPTLIQQRALELDTQLLPYVANRLGRRFYPVLKEFAQNADPAILTDEVLETVARLPEPWFVVVFYSTAHFPYAAPAPYYRMFTDPDYAGPFKYHKPHDLAEGVRTEADVQQVRDIFDGAVRAIDDQVGRLLGALDESGRLSRTIVVTTADHGENLYEGELGMGHGDHLRGEQSLRIPLDFWAPGQIPAGREIDATVRSIDLAPTLLELAGVNEVPPLDGESLVPLWQDAGETMSRPRDRPVFVETGIWFSDKGEGFFQQMRIPYPDLTVLGRIDPDANQEVVLRDEYAPVVMMAKHRALYQDGRKLLYMPTPDGVRWELFDPIKDPRNEHNLLAEEPQTTARLQAGLLAILADGDSDRIQSEFVLPLRQDPPAAPLPTPLWLLGREIMAP